MHIKDVQKHSYPGNVLFLSSYHYRSKKRNSREARKEKPKYPEVFRRSIYIKKTFLFPFSSRKYLSHPVTFFFFAYQAPNSRHSLKDVLLSSIRSLIILPSHMSHSSWLLPLTSRKMGSRA